MQVVVCISVYASLVGKICAAKNIEHERKSQRNTYNKIKLHSRTAKVSKLQAPGTKKKARRRGIVRNKSTNEKP